MTDTVLALGNDSLLFLNGAASVRYEATVLTATRDYQVTGWPSWHYRGGGDGSQGVLVPLMARFQGLLEFSGSAGVYDLNPIPIFPQGGGVDALGRAGTVDLVSELRGTFSDFAIWDGDDDPADFINLTYTDGTSGVGGLGTAWTKHSRSFTVPRRARYIVPQIGLSGLGLDKSVYLDAFQFGFGADPDTVPYEKVRQVKTKVLTPHSLEERVDRNYILDRALRENVALGVSVSEPEYPI